MAEKKKLQVKSFTNKLKIFEVMPELAALDDEANRLIKEKKVKVGDGPPMTTPAPPSD